MASLAYPDHFHSLKVSTGHTYGYASIPPSSKTSNKSAVVLLHGFPSSSWDWRFQAPYLASLGHQVIIPDLLGYGDTSQPASPSLYHFTSIAREVLDVLDHEGIEKAHFVAHDFGCWILSQIAFLFPERTRTATFLAVPAGRPGESFDVDMVNGFTMKMLGVEKFAYMKFLAREDSWRVMDEHPDSMFDNLWHSTQDPSIFYPPGALESWLKNDKRAEPPSWVGADWRAMHKKILKGGYRGPTNYYRALLNDDGLDEAKAAMKGRPDKMTVPVMFIEPTPGKWSVPSPMSGYADDLREEKVSTKGHWVQLEAKDEVNGLLEDFFQSNGGK